jgi:NAD(P)-dependent dehydrogenase (short-subunit alcohol dehydrogenase family)
MSSTAVYFVTGANRGIGLALVKELLSGTKDTHVFAGARSPSNATALKEIETNHPGKLTIVPFVAADEENNKAAAKIVADKFGYVDVVIGNAGVALILCLRMLFKYFFFFSRYFEFHGSR